MNKLYAFVIMLAGVATSAQAEDYSTQAIFQQRYALLDAAAVKYDVAAYKAMLAPNFVSVDINNQTRGANETANALKSMQKGNDPVVNTMITSIALLGKDVAIDQQHMVNVTKDGPSGSNAKANIVALSLSSDVWTNINGNWFLLKSVTNQYSMSINDIPVISQVRGEKAVTADFSAKRTGQQPEQSQLPEPGLPHQ